MKRFKNLFSKPTSPSTTDASPESNLDFLSYYSRSVPPTHKHYVPDVSPARDEDDVTYEMKKITSELQDIYIRLTDRWSLDKTNESLDIPYNSTAEQMLDKAVSAIWPVFKYRFVDLVYSSLKEDPQQAKLLAALVIKYSSQKGADKRDLTEFCVRYVYTIDSYVEQAVRATEHHFSTIL